VDPDELDSYVHGVMQTRGAPKGRRRRHLVGLIRGRVVIRNSDGCGTTFVPDAGIDYYLKWKGN
jgi:hypothetical protein